MSNIGPCLWFNGNAGAAAGFYCATIPNARMIRTVPAPGGPADSILTAQFELDGIEFLAINGGPQYTHSPAISFIIKCDMQEEVDRLWSAFTADGGVESQCGWLTDKFGVSWQIVPRAFLRMVSSNDSAAVRRVFAAMMPMKKLDVAVLERAFRNE